jgi:hypothetical protein
MLNSRNMNVGRIQGMVVGVLELGMCSVMEINVETTKIMRISDQPSPLQIMVDQNQKGECGIFQLFW